jgi:hypothetical protein
VPIETLATEIQSDVQHPWASFRDDRRSLSDEPEALLHRIHYERSSKKVEAASLRQVNAWLDEAERLARTR